MTKFDYVIVGGGMAADAATEGIRSLDPHGSICLISSEPDPPYDRPPLSKGLWKGKPVDSVWRDTSSRDVHLVLGRRVAQIHLEARAVVDEAGEPHHFERLLLATGGRPRELPFGDGVIYFRTYADFQRLWSASKKADRFGVIGGGFIGSEIAAALAMNGKEVTILFPEPTLGAKVFKPDVGSFLADCFRQKGVTVRHGVRVAEITRMGDEFHLATSEGDSVTVDCVVAGIGIVPNIELAADAGLPVDDGIVVDEYLQTAAPGVYAAGDVASVFSPGLATRRRVEHEDNALTMGRLAGRNMAGAGEAYTYLPYFYSDLFDIGYEAVGEVDARHEVVEDWEERYRKGVVYYHAGGRVRGVLLWNVWDKVEAARALIEGASPPSNGAITW